jgi:hypothetical protein
LQEQLRQQQREQPLPWQHQEASPSHQQQHAPRSPGVPPQPWHTGKPRWQSATAAVAASGIHWSERRATGRSALVPAGSSDSSGASSSSSSRSSSPSTASALAGSVTNAEGQCGKQGRRGGSAGPDLHKSDNWAAKAVLRPVSPAAAAAAAAAAAGAAGSRHPGQEARNSSSSRQQLPSFNGQVLPKELAALVGQHTTRRTL